MPGDSGLHYLINHDEGTLRVTNEDGEIVAAARLGQGGMFYDVATGEPIAGAVGGSAAFDSGRKHGRAGGEFKRRRSSLEPGAGGNGREQAETLPRPQAGCATWGLGPSNGISSPNQ